MGTAEMKAKGEGRCCFQLHRTQARRLTRMGKGLAFSMKEAVVSRVSKAADSREHDLKGLVGFRNVNYSNDLPLAQGIHFGNNV